MVNEKKQDIEKDKDLLREFLDFCYNLSSKEILWPEEYIHSYPKNFLQVQNDKTIIPFLVNPLQKLQILEKKITQWIQNQIGKYEHPYITYYNLQKFIEEIQEIHKNTFDSSLNIATEKVMNQIKKKKNIERKKEIKNSTKEKELKKIFLLTKSLKNKLNVPKQWKNYTSEKIYNELLSYFEDLSIRFYHIEKEKVNLEIELERYKNPNYLHPDYKKEIETYKQQIQQFQKELLQERSKNEILEKEVQRLTELIIENPAITIQQEELENLKREYQLLLEKYDLLVSKNIELRNLLEQQTYIKTLQDALNKIRDKINKILRTGGINEEVMIIKIKQEIEELQRARIYLGKALYDLGLLYLRLGRKQEALIELRAARELGIEDPEVNRIINQD
jgi:hypothetical protein